MWSEAAASYEYSDYAVEEFTREWVEIVNQNYNHPCIITWTPFNESWGVSQIHTSRREQHFTESIYHLTKTIDPYRPVIVNDGWEHTVSDILTLHDYEESGAILKQRYLEYEKEILEGKMSYNNLKVAFAQGFSYRGQPVIISEFGGIAFNNDDSGWGYGNKVNRFLEIFYVVRSDKMIHAFLLFDSCCMYEIVVLNYFLQFSRCDVKFYSLDGNPVRTMEGYSVNVDGKLCDMDLGQTRCFVVPGGRVSEIRCEEVYQILQEVKVQKALIAGICAGVDILDEAGVLQDVVSTHSEDLDVANDGNVITSRANGYVDFAIEVAKELNLFESETDLQETIDFWKYHKRM